MIKRRDTFVREVQHRLAELLSVAESELVTEVEPSLSSGAGPDLVVRAAGFQFVIECKSRGDAPDVAAAVRQVQQAAARFRGKVVAVVVAPYIGEVGRKICEEAGVCWLDLSGNAHLVAPGLRVSVQGNRNQYKRPGRPRTVFAPKSSRIARWLLMDPLREFAQRELAQAAGVDEGFTSRIVRQMEQQDLVVRSSQGKIRARDPRALLTAWRETYDFSRHHIVRGHVAARSGDEVLHRLATRLHQGGFQYAATGLAGAWLLNQFAGFRLVAIYVASMPSDLAQHEMGFHEESRGENVWLVVPNDAGVFHGAVQRDGICSAHPVQVYLDLKDHPERSAEAAESLRQSLFSKAGNV